MAGGTEQHQDVSFDDILAMATPRESSVPICVDGQLAFQHQELERQLAELARSSDGSLAGDPAAHAIAEQLEVLEEQLDAKSITFHFCSIGRQKWRDLLGKNPPTSDQRRSYPGLDHNPDRFPAVAIAASCVSPTMTIDQVNELEERLTVGQFEKLWAACLDANIGGDDAPKSAAGAILRRSAASVSTADLGESLDLSSSAE